MKKRLGNTATGRLLGLILSVAMLGAFGCGDDDAGGVDAGPGTDTGGTDAGGGMDPLPTLVNGDGPDPASETGIEPDPAGVEAPELSCFGMRTIPAGGDAVTFQIEIKEFRTDDTLEGLCVKFYDDNMPNPADTCDPDTDLTTDADGRVEVTSAAGGFYAYRVFPKDHPSPSFQIAGSIQINEAAPDATRIVEGNSVSQATLDLIPTVLGFMQVPGTALVAGTAWDCEEDPLYGGVVRIYREDGTLISEGTRSADPHYRYFDGDDFPKADQPWSHTDGLFAIANLPVDAGGEFVFVEFIGRRTDGGEEEVIACERMPIFADTISIVNLGPLRADAPSCPGLR